MTTKKIYLTLLGGILVAQTACNARRIEEGTYQTGPDGADETSAATDRAETTVAATDTAALILPADTASGKSKKRL